MSVPSMGREAWEIMLPVSNSGDISIMETPVCDSPMRRAHSAGLAPRYLGRREKWTLMAAVLGKESQEGGRSLP